ncbi:MAG: hypothetical protein F4089_04780 [Gammaproteobacteria bacterium]|nr:hypothetical protein [Dehalococcoidia bacterium]MYJ74445.1 hypothetical protein [Gammaproteobacteria bacterium]
MSKAGIDQQKLKEMQHAVDVVAKMVGVLQDEEAQRYAPENYAPQSWAAQAAADEATALAPEWAAWFQSWTRILSAADHIFALERVLEPEALLTFSPWTVARAVLEATEQVSWLLDPAIEERVRTARCLGLLRQDAKAQKRVANALRNEELVEQCNEILGDIRKLAKEFEVAVEERKGSSVIGASKDYHLLSGGFHQNQGINQALSLKKTKVGGSRIEYQVSLDEGQARYLLRESLRWFGIASHRHFSYCGFDLAGLEVVLVPSAKVLGLPQRFWEEQAVEHDQPEPA